MLAIVKFGLSHFAHTLIMPATLHEQRRLDDYSFRANLDNSGSLL